jgi:hypothetical protein
MLTAGIVIIGLGCSSPEGLGAKGLEPPAEHKLMPRFKLEKLEVVGDGLERRKVKKYVRMRLSMFRWCYENFL